MNYINESATSEKLKARQSELKSKLVDVLSDINRIKDQLKRANVSRRDTGQFSDRRWYLSAHAALNHLKTEHQAILMQLSEIKTQIAEEVKQENKIEGQNFARIFIRTAERVLPKDQYQQILTMTHLELDYLNFSSKG